MKIKEKVQLCKKLNLDYLQARANGEIKDSIMIEKKYLELRMQVINSVTQEITLRKSITLDVVHKKYLSRPIRPVYPTGISALDYQLVTQLERERGEKGGFGMGNFIQIAGAKGTGKSSIVIKIISNISLEKEVSWLNFEMGQDKVFSMIGDFPHTKENLFYYDGSREIVDIISEIKYLYADGVRHFFIDSMMKINADGYKRGYESFSFISAKLSELTSGLGINIYLINQVSQETEKGNGMHMKHGNDAEYDADYIFFIVKPVLLDKKGKPSVDEAGAQEYDQGKRSLYCTKNRGTHRLFKVDIPKTAIFGISPEIIEYQE